jgi:uncharacterized membrane protein
MVRALGLAGLLAGSGVLHFAAPQFYDAIVPRGLPGGARVYTYASGALELGVAAALAAPKTRRLGGMAAAGLFAAVFPANVQMAMDWVRDEKRPLAWKIGSLIRLPLQIPLMTTALKVARPDTRSGFHG